VKRVAREICKLDFVGIRNSRGFYIFLQNDNENDE
jgi:hypothetical protein